MAESTPVKDGYVFLMGYRPKGIENLKKKLDAYDPTKEMVKDHIKGMTKDEASAFFAGVGLPCAKINYTSESTTDPQILDRDMIIDMEHPLLGKYKAVNFPIKFSEAPGEVTSHASLLGQHNEEILKEYLGYSDEDIETFTKEGGIAQNLKG